MVQQHNTKHTPHYKLACIKELIDNGSYMVTRTAIQLAQNEFNLSPTQIISYVQKLQNINFYKSMTSEKNNKIWQDVYHLNITHSQVAYIKLQIIDEQSIVIQFKRK